MAIGAAFLIARHRTVVRSAAILLLAALAVGLVLLRPAAAGAPSLRLQGRVLRPDGRPAARDQVYFDVWREGLVPVTTNARGEYALTLHGGGRHWLEATLPQVGMSKLLQVDSGKQATVSLDLQLYPLPLVSGVIFLPDGRPAANAAFEVRGAVWRDLESMMDLAGEPRPAGVPGSQGKSGGTLFTVATDATGHYKVPLFTTSPPEHLSLYGEGVKYEIRLVSPDGRGWSETIRFTANLDHPYVHQDITLHAGEQVEGVVVGYPGGKPLPGAYVYAVMPGLGPAPLDRPEVIAGAIADNQGRFRIATALQPGGYTLGAHTTGGWGFVGAAEAEPKGVMSLGRRWVELQLVHDGAVHGRLLNPDGSPARDQQLPVTIRATAEGERTDYTADLETDAEGRYRLEFRASREARQPWSRGVREAVISMRGKEMVIPPVAVDLTRDSDQGIDLHLAETGGAYGKVTYPDGQPADGVSVYVAPAHEQARRWGTTDVHAFYEQSRSIRIVRHNGQFDLQGVPPGDYYLVVLACTIYETSPQDGTAMPVTIVPGRATGPFTLVVRPRSQVRGKLFGIPAAGDDAAASTLDCIVRPTGSSGKARRVRLEVEDDGRYTAWTSGFGMGAYDMVFLATYGGKAFVSEVRHGLELGASSVHEGEDFTLTPGGSIEGRLLSADGKPAAKDTELVLRPVSGDALMLFPLLICGQDDMGEPAFHAQPDADGQFSFAGLLPGKYELAVAWRAARAAESQVMVMPINLAEKEHRAGLVVRLPQAGP